MSPGKAAPRLKRGAQKEAHKNIGIWFNLVVEDDHGVNGSSLINWMLRAQFKAAAEGELPAIRLILKEALKILKARQERDRFPLIDESVARRMQQGATNADLAMVILGVAKFDNKELASAMASDGTLLDSRLASLRPHVVEDWVVDFARNRPGAEDLSEQSVQSIYANVIKMDRSNVSHWDEAKDELLGRLVRLRGPGASKFKAGVSGNRRGRPRKETPSHPHEDFLLAPVTKVVAGKEMTLTRLDALLHKLALMGVKDKKIGALLLRNLMPLHQAGWEDEHAIPLEPIKG